jgi:predicted Zn-dependent protease
LIEVTDLNAGNAPAALFLGRVCLASRAPIVAATQRLQRLSATAPDNADVLASYAACLSQANENAAMAEQLLNKAIALDPSSADAHLQLADLYMQQDKYSDAIRHYREVVRLRPEWADAHYRLARAYISAGQNEEAQREFTIHDRLRKQEQRRTELWDQH